MRAVLLIIATILLPRFAGAEQLATGSSLDPLKRAITPCLKCMEMETLRKKIFLPAQKDIRLKPNDDAMAHAYEIGDYLKELDEASLRGAHYNAEVESYMILSADAMGYDESTEIAETIAYLNITIGSSQIYQKVLSNMPNSCRKTYFAASVASQECEMFNSIEQEAAEESGRKAKLSKCAPVKTSIQDCEAKKALAKTP